MVTNAIANLANPPSIIKGDSYTTANLPRSMSPLVDGAFSGIMLFENNITEDANNIIPDFSANPTTGFANKEYTGDCPYRGTLNSVETKNLDNGKRYVWDFPTDKANGTIRSVALTSAFAGCFGGTTGKDTFNWASTNGGTDHCRFSTHFSRTYPIFSTPDGGASDFLAKISGKGIPVGCFKPNEVTFVDSKKGGKSLVISVTKIDYSVLHLKRYKTEIFEEKTLSTQNPVSDFCFGYNGKIYSIYAVAKNQISFIVLDGLTLKTERDEIITVQDMDLGFSARDSGGVFADGYLYLPRVTDGSNYKGFYAVNALDVSDYQYFDLPTGTYMGTSRIYLINEKPVLLSLYTSRFSDSYYLKKDGFYCGTVAHYYNGASTSINVSIPIYSCDFIKRPWTLCWITNNSSIAKNYAVITIDNCYMATINNLSTPVVKNETQTMKVTYEITEI